MTIVRLTSMELFLQLSYLVEINSLMNDLTGLLIKSTQLGLYRQIRLDHSSDSNGEQARRKPGMISPLTKIGSVHADEIAHQPFSPYDTGKVGI